MRRIVRGVIVAAGVVGVSLAGASVVAGQTAAPAGQTAANAASAAGTTPESAERASNESQVVQPGAAVAEPSRRLSVTAGFDFLTAYLFRGIYQEDHGLIMPPFVDVGISVYEGEGALKNVTINAGNWNSLHSGSSGHSGFGNAWYEADYYGSVSFAIGKWTPGALFTSYTSPNSAFNAVHEIAAVLAYDDSDSAFPLSPSVTLAFELHGQADGGERRGTYLELGIAPELTLVDAPRYPLTLSMPVTLGMSLRNYYEGPTGSNRFGFFDVGAVASVPLAFMSGRTTWEVHGGINVVWLGDNLRLFNDGDRVKPVGIVGLSVSY
jgi:hypothetical protein